MKLNIYYIFQTPNHKLDSVMGFDVKRITTPNPELPESEYRKFIHFNKQQENEEFNPEEKQVFLNPIENHILQNTKDYKITTEKTLDGSTSISIKINQPQTNLKWLNLLQVQMINLTFFKQPQKYKILLVTD